MFSTKWTSNVIKCSQIVMNVCLIALMIILAILMVKEVILVAQMAWNSKTQEHEILAEVVNFFLYFAFVSMIVVYFKEHYHFPLRYLLYIGITATLRFIIINRNDAMQNLLLSVVIVLLILGYLLLSPTDKGKS